MSQDALAWQVLAILPNVVVPIPTPFDHQYLCICSSTDPRLKALASNPANRTGVQMLGRFHDWFGRPYDPSCLLVREDAPPHLFDAEAITSFRNACALAALTNAAARVVGQRGQWYAAYSDFFFFAAHVPHKDGSIGTLDGPVRGYDDEIDKFHGECAGFADPVLLACSFACTWGGKTYQVGLPAAIYEHLYQARNDFMHGNPVSKGSLFFVQSSSSIPLFVLAPLVYNVALRSHTDSEPHTDDEGINDALKYHFDIERALLRAAGRETD